MSDKRPRETDAASLTGAYALDALTPEERDAFEAEFSDSESLRHETTELLDTAVLLGLATDPVQPSPALKASIMDRIASMPQLPPLAAPATPATVSAPEADAPSPAGPSAPVTAVPALEATSTPTAEPTAGERKAQTRWFTRPAVVLAGAAAVIGLVAGGGVLVNTVGEAQNRQVMADRLAEINAADDTQRAVSDVSGGGTATLVWSNELLLSALIVDGVDPLPGDKVYELWYIGEETGARPAGTFTIDDDGKVWSVLEGEMQAGDAVAVTVEPRGGSERPTGVPVVAIQS
jgi:anti-sigma-K factor RskA